MKSSHYLAIAVRLFAIALFLYALKNSTLLFEFIGNRSVNGLPASFSFILATTISPFAAAILLWAFPFSVTNRILRPEIDKPVEPLGVQSTLTVLIISIGLFALYYAIVDGIYWTTVWHLSSQSQLSSAPLVLMEENRASMVATAFELAISATLILKAKTLAFYMLRISK